ncbi:hypothetical protein TRAPUB_8717 [Trametes pubescens]|uniref:Uncharacterized protein n=1 Tax=Trametes pubescens TaxID=154538 RepID=A0A1M2W4F8_TRAPU|nr:hypothetical protein TRAPUB_8717 [Trametes pubescens]
MFFNGRSLVSPSALGNMSIGEKWEEFGMGTKNKESSFKPVLHETYGNFIGTADDYQG